MEFGTSSILVVPALVSDGERCRQIQYGYSIIRCCHTWAESTLAGEVIIAIMDSSVQGRI